MTRRARGEQGMITIWVLGLTVAVLFLGGIGLDLWRAVAVRREVSAMADAAALAGAAGLDEPALRTGTVALDRGRVDALARTQLAQEPGAAKLTGREVAVVDGTVVVTLREDVRFSLLSLFLGGGHFTVQASASARPREVP